ncbi:hypothetical protein GS914_21810 [Rhodococcus hoagii]|nr:hypothetical protein [Prescottella equi]
MYDRCPTSPCRTPERRRV